MKNWSNPVDNSRFTPVPVSLHICWISDNDPADLVTMEDIIIDFQSIYICCFNNTVDNGAGFCPADGIDQPPVVLSDTKAAQCEFCCIVVQRNFTVFQKYGQVTFLIHGIYEGFPSLGLWQDFILLFFFPHKKSVNQRFDFQLSSDISCLTTVTVMPFKSSSCFPFCFFFLRMTTSSTSGPSICVPGSLAVGFGLLKNMFICPPITSIFSEYRPKRCPRRMAICSRISSWFSVIRAIFSCSDSMIPISSSLLAICSSSGV